MRAQHGVDGFAQQFALRARWLKQQALTLVVANGVDGHTSVVDSSPIFISAMARALPCLALGGVSQGSEAMCQTK